MRSTASWESRLTAGFLVMLLSVPYAHAVAPPHKGTAGQQPQTVPSPGRQSPDSENLPRKSDSGATQAEQQNPDSPGAPGSQATDQNGQTGQTRPSVTSPPGTEQQDSTPQPVGTAAAPLEKNTGVAASRPAGAVIAPAKQRRAHSILIRVGIVLGAAVAIGTVTALSLGSSSRP